MYSQKDDQSIIIKGAGIVVAVIVLDLEYYLKVVSKQLENKEVYLEVLHDPSALVSAIFKSLGRIRKHGDL